jgi:hypothetical protein
VEIVDPVLTILCVLYLLYETIGHASDYWSWAQMCGLKCYVVAKKGGEIAGFQYYSHILGTLLQAYLFDLAIEAEDIGTPEDLSPNEYMEISPEKIEEVPNLQDREEHRTKP